MGSGARRLSKSCSPVSILVYVFMTIETCEHRPSNGILGAPTIADLPPVPGQRALRPPEWGAPTPCPSRRGGSPSACTVADRAGFLASKERRPFSLRKANQARMPMRFFVLLKIKWDRIEKILNRIPGKSTTGFHDSERQCAHIAVYFSRYSYDNSFIFITDFLSSPFLLSRTYSMEWDKRVLLL